jgi:hypothetical protein
MKLEYWPAFNISPFVHTMKPSWMNPPKVYGKLNSLVKPLFLALLWSIVIMAIYFRKYLGIRKISHGLKRRKFGGFSFRQLEG